VPFTVSYARTFAGCIVEFIEYFCTAFPLKISPTVELSLVNSQYDLRWFAGHGLSGFAPCISRSTPR